MKNAIIIHGMPDAGEYAEPGFPSENYHWFPWIINQLTTQGIRVSAPKMPDALEPNYELWKTEFEKHDITPDTLLVGYSCGGGFLIKWLSENKDVRVGKLVLVAPWLDPDRLETTGFFECILDPDLVMRTVGLTVFYSDDDADNILKSVDVLKKNIKNIKYRVFHGYGHFTLRYMKTREFPELLQELLS